MECFPNCKWLNVTEEEQNILKKHEPIPEHRCLRYNMPVRHGAYHPSLIRLGECDYDNSEPRAIFVPYIKHKTKGLIFL